MRKYYQRELAASNGVRLQRECVVNLQRAEPTRRAMVAAGSGVRIKNPQGQASNRPVATDPHDDVKVGFVLMREFEKLLLDVPPEKVIIGRSRHLTSDKFRIVRYRGGGRHGNLLCNVQKNEEKADADH